MTDAALQLLLAGLPVAVATAYSFAWLWSFGKRVIS